MPTIMDVISHKSRKAVTCVWNQTFIVSFPHCFVSLTFPALILPSFLALSPPTHRFIYMVAREVGEERYFVLDCNKVKTGSQHYFLSQDFFRDKTHNYTCYCIHISGYFFLLLRGEKWTRLCTGWAHSQSYKNENNAVPTQTAIKQT